MKVKDIVMLVVILVLAVAYWIELSANNALEVKLIEQGVKIQQVELQLVNMPESYNNLLVRYQVVNK